MSAFHEGHRLATVSGNQTIGQVKVSPKPASDPAAEIQRLEQELREMKRANEILKRAASFFGAEPGRQHR